MEKIAEWRGIKKLDLTFTKIFSYFGHSYPWIPHPLWRKVLGARAEYECVLERAARPFSKVSSTINSPYSLYWPPFPSEIAPPYRDQSPDEDLWIAAWFDNPVPRLLRILHCQCGKYFILSMRENTINRGDVRATQESHKDSDFLYTTDKEVHSLAFIVRYQFLKKVS